MTPHRELNIGDWLQHEAFKMRTSIKRAEIIGFCEPNTVMLYLDGEPSPQNITRAEVIRWWNYYLPAPRPEDKAVPDWCVEGSEFTTSNGKYHATIRCIRGAWLSFIETSDETGQVFRIKPFAEFKMTWGVVRKLSVWEWLRAPGV